MDAAEIITRFPHLMSPVSLAVADREGKYQAPPHIRVMNAKLMDVAFGPGGARTMFTLPYQHGKSLLTSVYYPAWRLLLSPETRIILVGHGEEFATQEFGLPVRSIVQRWGPDLNVRLRRDSKSKGQWRVAGREGGMVCRGPTGGVVGRPADEVLIDDLIRTPEQALSRSTLESHWNFYETVIFGRLRKKTNLILTGTRWCKGDIFGRNLAKAKKTGEQWSVVKFPAIATQNDSLGRRPGEALWPEQVSLEHLLIAQKTNRWWKACWQQEPEDEEGAWFKPNAWPRWLDTGDCYSLIQGGRSRRIYPHRDITRIVTGDWAWGQKSTSDYTALGVWGLTPEGEILVLDVVVKRFRVETLADGVADVCRKWQPHMVAMETGHPTFGDSYRRHPEIPEVRWLKTESKDKLVRALSAINMGGNGRIYLPQDEIEHEWYPDFVSQLVDFTGVNDEHDDAVDALSYGAKLAQELRPALYSRQDFEPEVLIPGRMPF